MDSEREGDLGFHARSVIKHLAGLLTGEITPTSEADREFIDSMTGLFEEKEDARDTELRMSERTQISKSIEQGSSEMPKMQKDV
jgi:hypothetical protein